MLKSIPNRVWAFDVEWVPDPAAGRLLCGVDGTDHEVIEEMWRQGGATEENPRPFLKVALCRIASIAVVERVTDSKVVRLRLMSLPRPDPDHRSEAEILDTFFEAISVYKPQLVGFNSESSDLPILVQRGLIHGISAPALLRPNKPWEGHDYMSPRYSDSHIDLLRAMLGFRGATMPSLHQIATLSGIPGKLDTDGSDVVDLWLAGDIDSIVAYNECDAITTYLLWLKCAHFCGLFDDGQYQHEQGMVIDLLNREKDEKPHLVRYADEWTSMNVF